MKSAAVFILGVLLGAAWGVFAADTTYMVKVMVVDHGTQELQAKFMVLPEDLRLVCHGEPKNVFTGDFAKVELKDGKFYIAGTECREVRWLR